jgi:sigma-B regulation protein RsbU (phosphoserine phosphatase)
MSSVTPPADRRAERLRKLTEISRALTYTTALNDVLRLVTERAAELLGADTSLLMLADEEGYLEVRATHGVDAEAVERFREPLNETLIRRLQGLLDAPLPESFLGVPLVAHGAVTGLLAVVRRGAQAVTEEDEWLLSAVADQVTVAIENARLEEEIRNQRAKRIGAEAADSATDRALATLSHDLRSPLNAIDSYAELIEMEILGPLTEKQREALGRIRMSGRHLLAVLENVLEMTRLSAGVVEFESQPVAAASVIGEAVLMVQPAASARNQSLQADADPRLILQADPNRLRQVLLNLLGNAIKYTPPNGTIEVLGSLQMVEGRKVGAIVVRDNGPGIAPDDLYEVFRPYYRIASAGSPEGAGLGLAISRELIRQMGGEIEVESELGRGSSFIVQVPTAAADPPPDC